MGVDVEQVSRFHQPPGGLFTDEEVSYCMAQADAPEAFAGTWCAKEAAVKALSSYVAVVPRDIHVQRDDRGAPHAGVHHERLVDATVPQLFVSISHSGGFAVAVVAAVLAEEST